MTARCKDGNHLLRSDDRKDWFQDTLLALAPQYGWQLEAWCVLSNHYHFVAHGEGFGAESLSQFIRHLHGSATREWNRLDEAAGRSRLWQNFRETKLTLQRGYLARLSYVHRNAQHHSLVTEPAQWKWGSASAFEKEVTPAWAKTIYSFRFDDIVASDGDSP